MLWILVAAVVVCASAMAALATASCCHRLARCVLGTAIDEIPVHNTTQTQKWKTEKVYVDGICSNIAHVQQPAGEVVLGVLADAATSTPTNSHTPEPLLVTAAHNHPTPTEAMSPGA